MFLWVDSFNVFLIMQVIPLSQRSGILEWCEGTQPIGEYLIGSPGSAVKGAHIRYRPHDWPPHECRVKLTVLYNNLFNK